MNAVQVTAITCGLQSSGIGGKAVSKKQTVGLVKDCRFWPEAGGGFGERRCSSTYSSPAVWKPTGRRSAWRLQELEFSTGRWGWAEHKHHKHSRIHLHLLSSRSRPARGHRRLAICWSENFSLSRLVPAHCSQPWWRQVYRR